jgi:hypothetical protein
MASVGACAYAEYVDDEGFARTDDEIRRVLHFARAGIARYGFGEELHPDDLARPWGNGRWQDNAWLRGVRDVLEWVIGDRGTGPLAGTVAAASRATFSDLCRDLGNRDEVMMQGSRIPVRPGWPPPQSAEAMDATLDWLCGAADEPPATEHGGAYRFNEDWLSRPLSG